MKASFHPTEKGPSRSEKLQLGGIPLRVVLRKNCIENVECHAAQILLWLKSIKFTHYSSPGCFSLRRVFGHTCFNEVFLSNDLQFKFKFTHLSTLGST